MSVLNMIEKRISGVLTEIEADYIGKPDSLKEGIAFMLYSLKEIFKNWTIDQIEEGIVDSAYREEKYDYGIDAIYLTANGNIITSPDELNDYNDDADFVFHIMQFKKGTGIDVNSLLKLRDGIKTVFIDNVSNASQNEYLNNYIHNLVDIRDRLYEDFPSEKIKVLVYVCFSGLKSNVLSNDLQTSYLDSIKQQLADNAYNNTDIIIIGAQELIALERNKEEVTDILKYIKAFKYITATENEKLNGYLCVVDGAEIGRLVHKWKTALFEANIRDYFPRNSINSKIIETCTSETEAKYFWSFNNGLTITCQKTEELPNDKYKLHGMQIVNGCQTSNSLCKAYINTIRYNELDKMDNRSPEEKSEFEQLKKDLLNPDTTVLVKLIETNNPDLIYRITETTNSQTPIKIFSLKANEDIHKNIELYFLDHKVYYERRVNYYKNKGLKPVIGIQMLAQLYLSMILFKPSQARSNPKKMFVNHYNEIFPSPDVKTVSYRLYLIPVLIDQKTEKTIKHIRRTKAETDEYSLALLGNARFHLDCYILKSILGNKYSEKGIVEGSELIMAVLKDDALFMVHFQNALYDLTRVVQNFAGQKKEAVSAALRKAELDKRIIRDIHRKR